MKIAMPMLFIDIALSSALKKPAPDENASRTPRMPSFPTASIKPNAVITPMAATVAIPIASGDALPIAAPTLVATAETKI